MQRNKFLAAALGGLTVAASLVGTAPAAQASPNTITAHKLFDYPYASASDCVETPGVTTGCVRDKWLFYQGQCVSWVAHRLNTLSEIPFHNTEYKASRWGYAGNWGKVAKSVGIPVNGTPARGAVAYYSGAVGHVAFVEQVNPDGSVIISEMNHGGHNEFYTTRITKSYRWPTGFIHFKDLPNTQVQYWTRSDGTLMRSTLPSDASFTRGTLGASVKAGANWHKMGLVTQVPDMTGDKMPELVARRNSDGKLFLYTSRGTGWSTPKQISSGWGAMKSLAATSEGNSRALVAVTATGQVRRYKLTLSGITSNTRLTASSSFKQVVSVGDVNADRKSDLVVVKTDGNAVLYYGTASGGVSLAKNLGKVGASASAQVRSHEVGKLVVMEPSGAVTIKRVSPQGFAGSYRAGTYATAKTLA